MREDQVLAALPELLRSAVPNGRAAPSGLPVLDRLRAAELVVVCGRRHDWHLRPKDHAPPTFTTPSARQPAMIYIADIADAGPLETGSCDTSPRKPASGEPVRLISPENGEAPT